MPTYERRFFIGMLTKEAGEREEQIEKDKEQTKTNGSKGNRTTTVSGDALKSRINKGDLPLS